MSPPPQRPVWCPSNHLPRQYDRAVSSGTADDLAALLRSRIPIVVIESRDEARVRSLVLATASQSRPPLAVFEWLVTEGLRRTDIDLGTAQRFNSDPNQVLRSIRDGIAGIYVLLDFHPYLDDPLNLRLLKDIAQDYPREPRTVVLLSQDLELPAGARDPLRPASTSHSPRARSAGRSSRRRPGGGLASTRASSALMRSRSAGSSRTSLGCRPATRTAWPARPSTTTGR